MSDSSKRLEREGDRLAGMDMQLDDRVVLVTGATSGIGRATALAFAREGARVALTYHRHRDAAEETARLVREEGSEALALRFALEEPDTASETVERVVRELGGVHVLVNNAVRWPRGFWPVSEVPRTELEASLMANVVGTVALIQAAIGPMSASGFGRIITISTGLVQDGLPGSAAYVAAKGALHALHRTLAKELGAEGVLCNVLMSGTVDNQRPRPAWLRERFASYAATGRMTAPEDVARAALFLGSGANGHVHGEALRVDGLFVSPLRLPEG